MKTENLILLIGISLILLLSGCAQEGKTTTGGEPAIPPEKVVSALYSEYLQTWPPKPVNEITQFSPAFAESLTKNQQEGMFVMPFICAQDFPASMEVQSTSVNGDTAKVTVKSSFGNSIELTLKVIGEEWKIDNAICK